MTGSDAFTAHDKTLGVSISPGYRAMIARDPDLYLSIPPRVAVARSKETGLVYASGPKVAVARTEGLEIREVKPVSDPEIPQKSSALTGLRHNAGKPRVDLVAPSIMTAIAAVAAFGAEKYAARNWEKGMEYGKVYASLMRHLMAWWQGEEVDAESGLPHLHHVAWNVQALVEYDRRLKAGTLPAEVDDRPHKALSA